MTKRKVQLYLCFLGTIIPLYLIVAFNAIASHLSTKVDLTSILVLETEEVNIETLDTKLEMNMKVDVDELEDVVERLRNPKGKQYRLLETKPIMHNPRYCFKEEYHSPFDQESDGIDSHTTDPSHRAFLPVSGWVPVDEKLKDIMTEKIDWVFYVHSSIDNLERRQIIRKTWGNPKLFKKHNMRIIFVVGTPFESFRQKKLEMEFSLYGDILQGDFLDTYKNLSYKAVFALRWLSTYCSHVPIVMKADDDTFVNIFEMKKYLVRYSNFSNRPEDDDDVEVEDSKPLLNFTKFNIYNNSPLPVTPKLLKPEEIPRNSIICPLYSDNTMPIMRDKASCMKWCVNKRDLSGMQKFPKYCSGLIYFLSMPLVKKMCSRVQSTPFLWVDDVYVTGLLPRTIPAINYVNIMTSVTLKSDKALNEYKNLSNSLTLHVVHMSNTKTFATVWNLLLKRLTKDDLRELTVSVEKLKLRTTIL